MTDKKNDPLDGELENDADLGPAEDDDAADDIAAALPGDASGMRVDGGAPLP